MISLHFFHTNDIHSHFGNWASLVQYLNQERRRLQVENTPYLTIDLGDHMDRVNPLTEGLLGEGNVRLLNEAGYDFITIGNNEGITFTKDILDSMYKNRQFEVILANLYDQDGKRPDWCRPYVIREMNGVKVGLVGLTAAFPVFYRQLGWNIRDPFLVLKPIVQILKEEADVVVLLSHVGLPFDERVAEELDGIDVILGAHTHHLLEKGLLIRSTLIAQTGKYGRFAGHVVVDYDEKEHAVVHKAADVVPLDEKPDEATEEILKELAAEGTANMQQVVASLDHDLAVDWFNESELPEIMADALRKWCKADIGLINAGVILGELKAGPVTQFDIHRICPHPINPCQVYVTGEEIISMINKGQQKSFQTYQLKGFGFRGKVLGRLVFSHLTYRLSSAGGVPQAADVKVNGEPIRLEKKYSIGTTDMFTFGTFLPPIVKARQRFYLPETLRDLLAWRLKQLN